MLASIRKVVVDTPLEPLARWAYVRFWPGKSALYDRQTLAVLNRVLRPDSNAVDVGAHRAGLLREIVRLAPRGRHLAVEPIPGLAAALRRNWPMVEVRQAALGAEPSSVEFLHVVSDPGISGMRRTVNVNDDHRTEIIKVPVERLDDLVPADRQLALIKIDVEGAEYGVLQGGAETIRRCRPVVVFECGLGAADKYLAQPAEATFDLLAVLGLQVGLMGYWLAGGQPFTRDEFLDQFYGQRNYYFLAADWSASRH